MPRSTAHEVTRLTRAALRAQSAGAEAPGQAHRDNNSNFFERISLRFGVYNTDAQCSKRPADCHEAARPPARVGDAKRWSAGSFVCAHELKLRARARRDGVWRTERSNQLSDVCRYVEH